MSEIIIPTELLPVPLTLFEITWAVIGFQMARAFSKRLDEDILEELEKMKEAHPRLYKARWLIERTLHFIHHYWLGMLALVYFPRSHPLFWIGYGMFIEDGGFHLKEFLKTVKRVKPENKG
jgi:hypothetical protein